MIIKVSLLKKKDNPPFNSDENLNINQNNHLITKRKKIRKLMSLYRESDRIFKNILITFFFSFQRFFINNKTKLKTSIDNKTGSTKRERE